MYTAVMLGAGQAGRAFSNLLNHSYLTLLAFGDNNPELHGTRIGRIPVMSVEQAIRLEPQFALIGVIDSMRGRELRQQADLAGFCGTFIHLHDLYRQLDIRTATLLRMAERITEQNIPGSIAELGVYKGDTACVLNQRFPERRLYLFDTFQGFDSRDIATEMELGCSKAAAGDFSDTSAEAVLSRMPHPDRVVIRKGYFPKTSAGLKEERYALVSLDADLYAPLSAGLEYFYPRLNPGGMILLHDYNNGRFRGARQAVADYEKNCGSLLLLPLCDLHGSAVIVHP
ncbi:class I SAM-dependent methyltransferase [Anaerovorax odorimutans]|uniref:Class I SAM-dependent methyltransferase n=1 Tax=Anaerovorax odorimutans TaxID=109327 RepID=A0ABT1RPD1_9FIRM|nr:TylF/MycF/NovP-related O-methyltransferase [Anaerovorax odorimutans]MCQ4637053.1 class I SAM-dependent methyltransferase [Anaerovorax odorimutans]